MCKRSTFHDVKNVSTLNSNELLTTQLQVRHIECHFTAFVHMAVLSASTKGAQEQNDFTWSQNSYVVTWKNGLQRRLSTLVCCLCICSIFHFSCYTWMNWQSFIQLYWSVYLPAHHIFNSSVIVENEYIQFIYQSEFSNAIHKLASCTGQW